MLLGGGGGGGAKVGFGALNKIEEQKLETLDVQRSNMFQKPAESPVITPVVQASSNSVSPGCA